MTKKLQFRKFTKNCSWKKAPGSKELRKCLIRIKKKHNLREKLEIIEIVGSSTSHKKNRNS